ncbi:recombinase family protein [Streptomyces sp. NPDC059631]|uniref:recombinase family protein n=1 Tax=unclassified Streptomyces TaxID=2593676 RepID=UPI00369A64C8
MPLSDQLQTAGVQLELLTGPLTGIYDPNGMGAMFFAVLAVAAQLDRNYIREKPLDGQVAAAAKGNHGGRPKVIDDDMLLFARALKDKGVPVRDRGEADHQDREERRTVPLRRLRPPRARRRRCGGRGTGRAGHHRPAPADPGRPHRPRQRHRPRADAAPHPAGPRLRRRRGEQAR